MPNAATNPPMPGLPIAARHIQRADSREWFEGPDFSYADPVSRSDKGRITVHVPASSWPLRGIKLSEPVIRLIAKIKTRPGDRVLDFGAGSWLRYARYILEKLPAKELVAVEFAQAFREGAKEELDNLQARVTCWSPAEFRKAKSLKYDLILLVNVLNTVPEPTHREAIFETLAKRLNPLGWLTVYQRVWTLGENPANAVPYCDGWMIPSPHHSYYSYRAKTGVQWFTAQANRVGLKSIDPGIRISSSNTIFRVWEKPFK